MVDTVFVTSCVWHSNAWAIILCRKASSECQAKVHQHNPATRWCRPTANNYNEVHGVSIFLLWMPVTLFLTSFFKPVISLQNSSMHTNPLNRTTSLLVAGLMSYIHGSSVFYMLVFFKRYVLVTIWTFRTVIHNTNHHSAQEKCQKFKHSLAVYVQDGLI